MRAARFCQHCGVTLERQRQKGGKMEPWSGRYARRYCSPTCRVQGSWHTRRRHDTARRLEERSRNQHDADERYLQAQRALDRELRCWGFGDHPVMRLLAAVIWRRTTIYDALEFVQRVGRDQRGG